MNIQIKKLKYGGFQAIAAPPLQLPTQAPSGAQSTLGASVEDLLPKAVLSDLMLNGMPSDVELFYSIVQQFAANDPYGSFDKNEMYKISALSNRVIQNSKYMDKAVELATNNDALEQYAVDLRGFVYTMDSKGNISSKSLSAFDAQKDRALTISELINFRRFSPEMALRTDVINTVGNSIGMTKINDYILTIIEKVGKATSKQEAYIDVAGVVGQLAAKEPSSTQKAALEQAYKEMSLGSYLAKLTQQQTSKNVNEAFNYIYSVLPKNMKATLEATYIINGGKKTSNYSYSADIIKQALLMNNDIEEKRELSNPFKLDGGASGAGGSSKTHRLTGLEVLANGDLNKLDLVFNTKTSTNLVLRNATVFAGVPTKNNDIVQDVPMSLALRQGMGSLLDMDKVWLGDLQVTPETLNQVLLLKELAATVYLPEDEDGNIDFAAKERFELAEEEINRNPHLYQTDDQKNAVHKLKNSPGVYKNGKLDTTKGQVGRYFVTFVTAPDDIIEDSNKYKRELSGDEKDLLREAASTIYDNKLIEEMGFENPFSWWDDIYKMPVFIKYTQYAAYDASVIADHGPLDPSVSTGYRKALQLEQQVKPVLSDSQILFLL